MTFLAECTLAKARIFIGLTKNRSRDALAGDQDASLPENLGSDPPALFAAAIYSDRLRRTREQ